MNVRDLYRELNQSDTIPKIEGQGSYTADEMIWFGEQVSNRLGKLVMPKIAEDAEDGWHLVWSGEFWERALKKDGRWKSVEKYKDSPICGYTPITRVDITDLVTHYLDLPIPINFSA